MDNTVYIYGLEIQHTDGTRSIAKFTFDGEPTEAEQDMLIESLVPVYGKSYDDIRAAWFLFEKYDEHGAPTGEPAQFDDLFEYVETDYGDETQAQRIARLEAEADAEAAEQLSAMSAQLH